uniref:Uncharacterized protein n=1 Tax=Parascaris equorum TaxID=6256 RepID=A0A914RKG6_PAREQ
MIGTAANVQCVLGGGNITSAHIAWGIGFAFAVFLAANASGGHLNPAISLTAYFLGNLSFIRFLCYSLIQVIGAFCGTAITFLSHYDNIYDYDHGIRNVVGVNATAALLGAWLYKLFIGLHGLNEQLDIISGPPYPKIDKGYRVSSVIPVE